MVDRGQHGHSDWSAAQAHTQQAVRMHSVHTFDPEPALTFSTISEKEAYAIRLAFAPHTHRLTLGAHAPVASSPVVLPQMPSKTCNFGDALTQLSSRHNLILPACPLKPYLLTTPVDSVRLMFQQ